MSDPEEQDLPAKPKIPDMPPPEGVEPVPDEEEEDVDDGCFMAEDEARDDESVDDEESPEPAD